MDYSAPLQWPLAILKMLFNDSLIDFYDLW